VLRERGIDPPSKRVLVGLQKSRGSFGRSGIMFLDRLVALSAVFPPVLVTEVWCSSNGTKDSLFVMYASAFQIRGCTDLGSLHEVLNFTISINVRWGDSGPSLGRSEITLRIAVIPESIARWKAQEWGKIYVLSL